MEDEALKRPSSFAAPILFSIVLAFHIISRYLEFLKKRGGRSSMEMQLRTEIKQLLKEANSLSQPSTFAQAAKLRRKAAAKEKELEKYQKLHGNAKISSYDLYLNVILILKASVYLLLVWLYWGVPVTIISKQLVQPFGKVLSWTGGRPLHDKVMVGIVPWLIVSTRVIKFVSGRVVK